METEILAAYAQSKSKACGNDVIAQLAYKKKFLVQQNLYYLVIFYYIISCTIEFILLSNILLY